MITADAVHLLAGSVWLGGVVALAAVLPLLAERAALAAEALARFSVIGAGLLVALVATGGLLAWRILGSWSALVETGYGRLLIAKVVTVLVVVLLAGWNRFILLPRMHQGANHRERRAGLSAVTRVVTVEAVLLGIVLVFTGLLVDRNPDVVAEAARPVAQSTVLGKIDVKATVASPVTGPSAVSLELVDSAGQPTEGYAAPKATLSSASLDLGEVALQNVGPGVYAGDVVFPSPGVWELQISLRTGEFDNPVGTVSFTIEESSR